MRSIDTEAIIAIATAAGCAGIGVIRLSFGNADSATIHAFMRTICGRTFALRYAAYVNFLEANGQVLDHGIALWFVAPHSYTGEHIIELQGHGGQVVLQLVLQRCLAVGREFGLRLAEPGEFTRRAFLNDKLDLAQAEAVADLIDASTETAARAASRALHGAFSAEIVALTDALTTLRMLVEATLDFPEEALDFLQAAHAHDKLTTLCARLEQLYTIARQGALLRNGLSVVLAGQPNAGKSSLLNALAKAEVAIVTAIPGTTRDKITQTIQIEGVALHIIDTAGLRDAQDEVEQLGIARAWQEIAHADVVLHLRDARDSITLADHEIAARFPAKIPVLNILNKTDLTQTSAGIVHTTPSGIPDTLALSAKTGAGVDLLRTALLQIAGWQAGAETVTLARERHLIALRSAHTHLQGAFAYAASNTLELFAEELRLAQLQLHAITGVVTSDDLLGAIFSQFCIGK